MEPDEYRNRLAPIAVAAAAQIRLLFSLLPANPTDATWRRFVSLAYGPMMLARRDSFELSQEFYAAQRPSTAGEAPEFVERSYPEKRLEKALEPARARLMGVDELDADERRLAEESAEAITKRHVLNAGRDTIEDAVKADEAAIGWARYPTGAETCAFCVMIISRGPRFKTIGTAGAQANNRFKGDGLFKFHNNDDCLVVAVFDKNDWPGREHYLAAKEAWSDATGGYKGRDALNALRRHLYATRAS